MARARTLIVAGLALLVGVAVAGPAMAQGGGGAATVEVRVWQNVDDDRDLYVSARPAGGSWRALGTVPLALDGLTASGAYRYGDVALAVPGAGGESMNVQLRVWQDVDEGWRFFLNARPAGGSWSGTRSLLPADGLSASGRYRYGDIELALRPQVTTLAGRAGKFGYADGPAGVALFGEASGGGFEQSRGLGGLAIDGDGNVIVADAGNHAIRRIAPDGTVTTIAGGNGRGLLDGPAAFAQFAEPMDVDIAADGSIYVADAKNHRIRRIVNGAVTTVAGSGPTFTWSNFTGDARGGHRDGPARRALLNFPHGIAFAPDGGLLILEEQRRIRRLAPNGWVSTFAESDLYHLRDGAIGDASFGTLRAVDTDADGNVYVVDSRASIAPGAAIAIRKIDTSGYMSTLFSSAPAGAGGVLSFPSGLAVTDDGTIYVANTGRHQILELRDGELYGVAGTGDEGRADGDRDEAAFNLPGALAIAGDGALVVADEGNRLIRRVVPADGDRDARVPAVARAEWLPATVERFTVRGAPFGVSGPRGMALDAAGHVIVADFWGHAIRRISPGGTVATIAGGNGEGVRDGAREHAQFAGPWGVAVHADGSIYVADSLGNRIRRIAPDGPVTTVAGGGPIARVGGYRGEFRDGPATLARFREPTAIAFDGDGNLLIADSGNNLIRKLSPTGEVSSFADVFRPRGVAVDASGNVFATQTQFLSSPVVRIERDGSVSALLRTPRPAGGGTLLIFIEGIVAGPDGVLYVADSGYDRVARIAPDGSLAFVVGGRGTPFGFAAVLPLDDGTLLASGYADIWKITIDGE